MVVAFAAAYSPRLGLRSTAGDAVGVLAESLTSDPPLMRRDFLEKLPSGRSGPTGGGSESVDARLGGRPRSLRVFSTEKSVVAEAVAVCMGWGG